MKAYAVLGSDDHFVGIWRGRETAENVMARSAWAKGERIVEMVSAESVAELEAERDRWERNCLEWRVAHDTLCAELDALKAALANLVREAKAVADDHHRPRYARLDAAIASALAAKEE